MKRRTFLRTGLLTGVAALGATACSRSKFKRYRGPTVTRVVVDKGTREMYLYHGKKLLEGYNVELGFTADGHKQFEGDGKTPEGDYFIDRRNPNSSFHLSLGISYPNRKDRAFAAAAGKNPGGDIFIHGQPNWAARRHNMGPDWTAGCIAVKNREMETIYAMVRTGTPIRIYA
ncbi:MAG: L,D-transpeptidase family protein [Pseudomonadota bacterium]